jgi:hypothetical protein
MKIFGIILILLGIALIIFEGIRSTEKEKVLDVGPIEITKQEKRSDSWQLYVAGGVAIVAGLILAMSGRKRVS